MLILNSKILGRTLNFIANIGIEPGDSSELRLKKTLLTVSVLIYGVVFLTFIGPLYIHFHEPRAAAIYGGFGLVSMIGLVRLAFQPRFYRTYVFLIFVFAFSMQLSGTLILGGFINSSGFPMWGLAIVLGLLTQYSPRTCLYWLGAYICDLILTVIMQPHLRSMNNLPPWLVLALFVVNLVLVSSFSILPIYQFIKQRDEAMKLFQEEKQKSETLLLNILPMEIADVLKTGQSTIAEHYENASILFADVVDFTSLSEQLTPNELVELLNDVFSHFDTLAGKYQVEKIKTIGDCYMVAAGVPRPRLDHAHVITRMAMEMQSYVRGREFNGHKLVFRMGISSGPVVAGVIGSRKFIYDLWGDTVNTASRMESNGIAGVIQVTEATYNLINDQFDCASPGLVAVKGKGELKVWHVLTEQS